MKAISPFGLPIGISVAFWSLMGLLRLISEVYGHFFQNTRIKKPYKKKDIAAILPAHNEEKVIERAIAALRVRLRAKQIYVASDGSTDKTTELARALGVNVVEMNPGLGKAKAMKYLIEHFRLFQRYKLIFIIDADTQVDENFFPRALELFKDPDVAVVFGRAELQWKQHFIPKLEYYFITYRERLNKILWNLLIYGQTWKYTNTMFVVPGFCTLYRSDVLSKLEIDTPGLLIEDFNLAFQLQKKKLGTVGHARGLIGWDQHPDNLPDYWKQVRRWNIGFFQTVKKNGFWPSFFWLSMSIFSIEVILNSLFTLVLPIYVFYLFYPSDYFRPIPLTQLVNIGSMLGIFEYQPALQLIFNIFIIDYLFSVFIGIAYKKPQMLFYGLFYFPMHWITSLILIFSIIPGFFSSSEGRWISPTRQ